MSLSRVISEVGIDAKILAGGEVNTNTNVGTGAGLVLPKVGVDTPLKSLISSDDAITITQTAEEIDFTETPKPFAHTSTISLSPQLSTIQGLDLTDNDTKLFAVTAGGDSVFKYDLGTPADITSRVYNGENVYVGSNPRGVQVRPDGTGMFITNENVDNITEMTLPTAYSPTGATFNANTLDLTGLGKTIHASHISNDGLNVFLIVSLSNNFEVVKYSLGTAYTFNTATLSANTLTLTGDNYEGILINSAGDILRVLNTNSDDVVSYTLGTPNSLAGAVLTNQLDVSSQTTQASALAFNQDETVMILGTGSGSGDVHQYMRGLEAEANTNSNAGAGAGLVLPKVGVDTPLKTLKTSGIATITSDADSVTIDVPNAPQPNSFDPVTTNNAALTNANLTVSPTATNGQAYAEAIIQQYGIYNYSATFQTISSTTVSSTAIGAVSSIIPNRPDYLGFNLDEFAVYPYTNRIDLYINGVIASTAATTLTDGDTINISLNPNTKVVEVSVNGGATLITQSLAGMSSFIPAVNVSNTYGDITVQFDTLGAAEANTNSNTGAGAGLVLPKVGVDTPIKSLTSSDGSVLITENANEVDLASSLTTSSFDTITVLDTDLANAVVGHTTVLRKEGNVVYMNIRFSCTVANTFTNIIASLPNGFRPFTGENVVSTGLVVQNNHNAGFVHINETGDVNLVDSAGGGVLVGSGDYVHIAASWVAEPAP